MYKHYFGLNEPPFSIAPDPRYLYMSEMHQEALAHLAYGAASDGCIILLTGEVGTGKTTICRRFLEQLGEDTDVAVIINPKLTGDELLATICDEFQIAPIGSHPSTKNYIDSLNAYLLSGHSVGKQALLVIDEAQNLDLDVLEMLRLLTNLETDQRKLLKIFLLGQSELSTILSRPDLLQINQRITSRYHLKGLHRHDVEAYISHRISIAGGGRARLFNSGALKRIFEISRGIPRLINNLCDRALLGAYSEGKDRVDPRIIRNAAREIFGDTIPVQASRTSGWLFPALGLVIILVLVGLYFGSTTNFFHTKTAEILSTVDISSIEKDSQPDTEEPNPQQESTTAAASPPAEPSPSQPKESVKDQDTNQRKTTRIFIEPMEVND